MKKTILALATAVTLAAGTLGAPTAADARCYGCGVGAGVAAGVIGGAIIGGAIANSGLPLLTGKSEETDLRHRNPRVRGGRTLS